MVISLPVDWLRARGLQEGGEVEVRVSEGEALEIRPIVEVDITPDFAQQVDACVDHYREALDELAKR